MKNQKPALKDGMLKALVNPYGVQMFRIKKYAGKPHSFAFPNPVSQRPRPQDQFDVSQNKACEILIASLFIPIQKNVPPRYPGGAHPGKGNSDTEPNFTSFIRLFLTLGENTLDYLSRINK